VNIGDEGDLFRPGQALLPGSGSNFPNTDSYQGGNIAQTGFAITVESMNEAELTFKVTGVSTNGIVEVTDDSDQTPTNGGGGGGGGGGNTSSATSIRFLPAAFAIALVSLAWAVAF